MLISHPFALSRLHALLGHIDRLRTYLQSRHPSGETAHIARDILLDLVDCSGLELTGLHSASEGLMTELSKAEGKTTL
jgi:hypothetical protein